MSTLGITVLSIIGGCIVAWILLLFLSGRFRASWELARIIETDGTDVVRMKLELTMPDGTVLREMIVTGWEDTWHVEDEWGSPVRSVGPILSALLEEYWANHISCLREAVEHEY